MEYLGSSLKHHTTMFPQQVYTHIQSSFKVEPLLVVDDGGKKLAKQNLDSSPDKFLLLARRGALPKPPTLPAAFAYCVQHRTIFRSMGI